MVPKKATRYSRFCGHRMATRSPGWVTCCSRAATARLRVPKSAQFSSRDDAVAFGGEVQEAVGDLVAADLGPALDVTNHAGALGEGDLSVLDERVVERHTTLLSEHIVATHVRVGRRNANLADATERRHPLPATSQSPRARDATPCDQVFARPPVISSYFLLNVRRPQAQAKSVLVPRHPCFGCGAFSTGRAPNSVSTAVAVWPSRFQNCGVLYSACTG